MPRAEMPGITPAGPPSLISSLGGWAPAMGFPPVFPPPIPCNPKVQSCKPPKSNKPPPATVPEPATFLLVSSGIAGIYLRRRKLKA
jgi:hypothetical protein